MKIKVLFDSYGLDDRFSSGWGVSFLIDNRVLFDTGENGEKLVKNMQILKVNPKDLESVVISHDHWDHQGGLWKILEINPKIKIYACTDFSKNFKDRVRSYGSRIMEPKGFTEILPGIYSTGQMVGIYANQDLPEQGLFVRTQKGLIIITGCAHPGIIRIIESIKRTVPDKIHLVLGGFHLMDMHKMDIRNIVTGFKKLGIQKVAPTHCTGNRGVGLFREEYGENCLDVKIGQGLEV